MLKSAKKILSKTDFILLEVSKNKMYNKQPLEREIINFLKKKNFIIKKKSNWIKIKNTKFMQRDILFKRKIN